MYSMGLPGNSVKKNLARDKKSLTKWSGKFFTLQNGFFDGRPNAEYNWHYGTAPVTSHD
jgi:hypothetical protein